MLLNTDLLAWANATDATRLPLIESQVTTLQDQQGGILSDSTGLRNDLIAWTGTNQAQGYANRDKLDTTSDNAFAALTKIHGVELGAKIYTDLEIEKLKIVFQDAIDAAQQTISNQVTSNINTSEENFASTTQNKMDALFTESASNRADVLSKFTDFISLSDILLDDVIPGINTAVEGLLYQSTETDGRIDTIMADYQYLSLSQGFEDVNGSINGIDGEIIQLDASITSIKGLSIDGDTAMGVLLEQLEIDAGGNSALITNHGTALVDLQGNAEASLLFRVKANTAGAEIELVAADNPVSGGSSSVRINAGELLFNNSFTSELVDTVSFGNAGLSIFGGTVKSQNYLENVRGWQLKEDGTARFIKLITNEAIVNGAIYTDSIQGNAVTVARGTSGSGSQSLEFTPPHGGALLIVASAQVSKTTGSGPVTASAQIKVNGVERGTGSAVTQNNGPNPSISAGTVPITASLGYGAQALYVEVVGDLVSSSLVILTRYK